MVGRLVQQEQVRLEREGQGQRGAFGLAAGQFLRIRVGVERKSFQKLDDPGLHMPVTSLVGVSRVGHARALHQDVEQRIRCGKSRLLLDRHDPQSVAPDEAALIQVQATGNDVEQA